MCKYFYLLEHRKIGSMLGAADEIYNYGGRV